MERDQGEKEKYSAPAGSCPDPETAMDPDNYGVMAEIMA